MARIDCFSDSADLKELFLKKIKSGKPEALAAREVLVEAYASLEKRLESLYAKTNNKYEKQTIPSITENRARFQAKMEGIEELSVEPPKPAKTREAAILKMKADIFGKKPNVSSGDDVYRLQRVKETQQFTPENWTALEKWLKANFPNLPVYRVKNAILSANGRQAWGMLHNGAIYLTENAEIGTAYHEVFEAVWKMFTTPKEREVVLDEFKNRKGSYVDAFTGKTLQYSEATELEAKEQLAEEFRDFVLNKKSPAKLTNGFSAITKLFMDLYNFIKAFFTGKDAVKNTADLFEKIGNGYYAKHIPEARGLSFAKNGYIDIENSFGDSSSEFRFMPYVQMHELMQHLTYSVLSEIVKNNASLFGVEKYGKAEMYSWLKDQIVSLDPDAPGLFYRKYGEVENDFKNKRITEQERDKEVERLSDLQVLVNNNWEDVVAQHTIYLKQYNIEFDENDDLLINGDEKDKGGDGHADARKVDAFRKANPAIKLLLSTLPKLEVVDGVYRFKRNSIGGVSTLPLDKTFITLKNEFYNSLNIDDMLNKLRELSEKDINYRTLYTRLTKSSPDSENVDYSNLDNKYDIELLSAFYKSMVAQNPNVKIVYILPSGEVEIGDAHLADATRQAKQDMFYDIVSTLKNKSNYVAYNREDSTYSATDKLKKLSLTPGNSESFRAFLKAIGVEFTKSEIDTLKKKGRYKAFEEAVNGVKTSIESISKVKDLNKYTIGLEGRLGALGALRAVLTNPDFESTYFNISGEKTQTYIGTNVVSDLYNTLLRINNLYEDLPSTPYGYLITDSFSKDSSVILSKMFNLKTGNRKEGFKNVLNTGILEGIVDQTKGKSKDSSNATPKERLIEELNLNSKGWFLNLVPGDASIEWMVNMFEEGAPFVKESEITEQLSNEFYDIIKKYFISEINVSREDRIIANVKGRASSDLRFFKGFLDESTHNAIVNNTDATPEELYKEYGGKVTKAFVDFIEKKAKKTFENLEKFGIVSYGENGFEVEDLVFAQEGISEEGLLNKLKAVEANYIIANIELHKLVYSDPYFYKDELKRIKNFNSPAQPLLSSDRINEVIHTIYNKSVNKNELGYTEFGNDYLVSAVVDDVESFIKDLDGYSSWKETDGGGMITMQANRNMRIRAANWNEKEEAQFWHDIGYEKLVKSNALQSEIDEYEKSNPGVKSAYTPLKPIVRGSKRDGNSYNDIVLDKFALMPLSFRVLHKLNPKSNALKHYQKMLDTGVDYTVYDSGRKVGAGYKNTLYNTDGTYNTAPFLETSVIPFNIISIQTEVPSKDKPETTQGSQITKLATMDFMDAGVPIDFKGTLEEWEKVENKEEVSPLYRMIKNNETLLIGRIKHGYDTLLDKLGISQEDGKFTITDRKKLVETLTSEIFKREVNDNIIQAFEGYKTGDVVLEATPAYQQIRNILYSIANKQVARPTISGGMKVQVPSTLLESVRAKEEDGKYTSDVLNFYTDEDGKRVCEIMVGRWFDAKGKTDEQLLRELNSTNALSGIGFRIPTQKQNSIDVFKIKKFLPQEFGDSVVIPSALVNKVGSDFDIDKLSIYLKNVYSNLKGEIAPVPFFGYGEQAKEKLAEMYDNGDFLSQEDRDLVNKWIKNRKIEDYDAVSERLFKAIFGDQQFDETYVQEVMEDFLSEKSTEKFKQKVVNEKYRQSLENEYISSLEELVSHELNYSKLIAPNSAEPLKELASEITRKLGLQEPDYTSVNNLLDREFMENLRHAFVRGKYAIGIAATSQTNNAQNQRAPIYIDTDMLDKQPTEDSKWLGDGNIKFKSYNKLFINGKERPTLSLSHNASGKLISDYIGMFIDGYVDVSKGAWVMDLGATPNTAGTWLFLVKLGVPMNTVAYFMNQPIIRDLLQDIENSGYTWIFNSSAEKSVKEKYASDVKINTNELPTQEALEKMVGKKNLTETEKAQQLFILDEFFKYSKLAEHLFLVQQGSNFDTATINDPYIVFKKKLQIERARTTMISSVDKLLKNSFVGPLSEVLFDIRDAFSQVLISDKPGVVRNTLENVLRPYANVSDRDFIKISQKAVADLFDWAVQVDGLNKKISSVLLGDETSLSAAEKIMSFVAGVKADKSHPLHNNFIVNSLRQTMESVKDNKAHNLSIAGKNNKAYDQNNATYGFAELREYLRNQENLGLYQKIVDLAVLQSGLSNSKISFTQLLPYEDFKEIYNSVLHVLDKNLKLAEFDILDVFQRNNWNNPDIVLAKKSKWLKLKTPYEDAQGRMVNYVKTPELDFLPKTLKTAVRNKQIPQVMQVSTFSRESQKEFIALTWEDDISYQEKKKRRAKGDYSYIKRGLFKKVYKENGEPLTTTYKNKKGVEYVSVVYKAINAWGDSYRANEFYATPEQSKIDNGLIKVKEAADIQIEKALNPKKQVEKGSDQIPPCA